MRGSCTTASPIATMPPASNERIMVSMVTSLPDTITMATRPSDPTAKALSLATRLQNSRRAMRIRRQVSSTDQATEASANNPAAVPSMPSIRSAIA